MGSADWGALSVCVSILATVRVAADSWYATSGLMDSGQELISILKRKPDFARIFRRAPYFRDLNPAPSR